MTGTKVGQENGKARSARGTSFPVLSLPGAVKVIRDAGSYGKQHSLSAMATYAGHTTANSGPFRAKMAALRDWGMVAGTGDTVVLTNAAMKIAHPTSPEATAEALLAAFRGCAIFWKFYEATAKGRDFELGALANTAVNNYGISISTKDQFVKSLVDSAEAVGLVERSSKGQVQFRNPPQGEIPAGLGDTRQTGGPNSETPVSVARGELTPQPVLRQVWPIHGGEITFEITSIHPIRADAFGQVGQVVQQVQELAALLAPVEEPDDSAAN
jgi:hypothetical protein